ncbi:hypothetical protein ACE83Q_07285 [Dellaglioa sp. P0083]|uniref:hypothetical protein n=1 Tax=Dellaglioa kimchii TaxID=3344667 RepID=UPI0038D4BCCB
MKIYSYRHFFVGLFFMFVGIASIWIMNLDFKDAFDWSKLIRSFINVVLSFGIAAYQFYVTFSKKGLKEEQLENADERNKLIDQSVNAMIGKIMNSMILILAFGFIILWAFLKVSTLLWIGALLFFLYTNIIIISIILAIYYEKKL